MNEGEKKEVNAEIEMAGWMRRKDVELVLTTLNAEGVSNIKKSTSVPTKRDSVNDPLGRAGNRDRDEPRRSPTRSRAL